MKKITKLFLTSIVTIPVISIIPISIISCSRNSNSVTPSTNLNYNQLLKQSRVTITKKITFDNYDTLSTGAILTSKMTFKYSMVYTWYVSNTQITITNNQITSKYLQAITTSVNYINLNQFTSLISGEQYYFAVSAFAFHQRVNNDQTIYKTNPIWSVMQNSITYIKNIATTNNNWVDLWSSYNSDTKLKIVMNAFVNFIRNDFLETIFHNTNYKWNTQYKITSFNTIPNNTFFPLSTYYYEFKLLNTQVTYNDLTNAYDLNVSFIYTIGTAQKYSQNNTNNIDIGNFIPVDNIFIETFKYKYNNIKINPINSNNINKLEFITNSNSKIQYASYSYVSSNINKSRSKYGNTTNRPIIIPKKQIIYYSLPNPTNNILWTTDNVTNND